MRLALLLVLLADTSPRSPWTFQENFSRCIEGRWEVVSGAWTFENGALVGRSGEGDCGVIKLAKPPREATELVVDVTLVGDAGEGVHIDFSGQSWFHYRSGWTGIYPAYADVRDCPMAADKTVTLRLRHAKGRYEFSIDGRQVAAKDGPPPDDFPTDLVRLYSVRGATVRYDNLRIR